ncbi:MAG: DUF1647 domain-containing protein [Dongiaceae bacterium]
MTESTLTIVTAASENHARPLLNLLFSLDRYEPATRVVVYDLGLSERTLDVLHRQRRTVVPFRFADYPRHVGEQIGNKRLRTYAWKPALIHEVLRKEGLPLLYLDAGDLVHERLDRVRQELARTSIYTPTSGGTLADWCHRGMLAAMRVEPEILHDLNRSAGLVGFGASDLAREIAEDWFAAAMQPEVICPPGADLKNHRFDQAVLSVLLARAQRGRGLVLTDDNLGISVHNDGMSFANVTAFIQQPPGPRPAEQKRVRPIMPQPKRPRRKPPLRRLWRRIKRMLRGRNAATRSPGQS